MRQESTAASEFAKNPPKESGTGSTGNVVTNDMRDKLKAPLPDKAVKPHPTKTYLSSIKAIYVTERLNDVFGIGAWQLRTEIVKEAGEGMVVCKTILNIPAYNIHLESYGGNDNGGEKSKNFDLGDAYKGATTDALTKICSYLEIGIDVFKGKGSAPKPPTDAHSDNQPISTWLSDIQFKAALAGDKKAIQATLNVYDGKSGKGMKKDFRQQLQDKLKTL